jgi:hypothetical protein
MEYRWGGLSVPSGIVLAIIVLVVVGLVGWRGIAGNGWLIGRAWVICYNLFKIDLYLLSLPGYAIVKAIVPSALDWGRAGL